MPRRRFDRGFEFWVMSASNMLERISNDVLSEHGLTFRQVQVLGALAMHEGLTQVQLAEAILVERSTVVRILDRMERDGWIERTPSSTDRRVNIIRETEKVDAIWKTIRKCGKEIRKRAVAGLSEAQLDAMSETLEAICENLGGPSLT